MKCIAYIYVVDVYNDEFWGGDGVGWVWGYLYQIEGEFYDPNRGLILSKQEDQVSAELQTAGALVQ
jgi:hypothetical protein